MPHINMRHLNYNKMSIFNVYKPLGKTPLETLESFRRIKKLPMSEKITYAGRLDPMAEGVLVLISGKDILNKESYLKLNKTYIAEILFGFSTDTFDLLGKVKKTSNKKLEKQFILQSLNNFVGENFFPLPPFSSPIIANKEKFNLAKKGLLKASNSETRLMKIQQIKFLSNKYIDRKVLQTNIKNRINKVAGDFRQKEILKIWSNKLETNKQKYLVVKILVKCESGTYIRSLAYCLGQYLKTQTVLYSLKRTEVGYFSINKSVKI